MTRAAASAASNNVAGMLWHAARERPEHPAIIHGDEAWSYRRLLTETTALAARLSERGVRPGDRVALALGDEPSHLVAWFGALAAGGIVVDLNTLLPEDELAAILSDADASLLVTDAERAALLGAVIERVRTPSLRVDDSGQSSSSPSDEPDPPSSVDAAATALIAYTSGTSGRPKGAVHTHERLRSYQALLRDTFGFDDRDVIVQLVPLFSYPAFMPTAANAVYNRATLVLGGKFDARRLTALSRRHRMTYVSLSSPMIEAILALGPDEEPDFSHVKHISAGAAPLSDGSRDRFTRRFGVPITTGYGMTELADAMVVDVDHDAPPGAVGKPFPQTADVWRVVDEQGERVAAGVQGEIVVHASRTCIGYWSNRGVLDDCVAGGWFATGDVGFFDEAGFLHLTDRKKDMIIRGGFNIYTAEIEAGLSRHPMVREVVVFSIPHPRLGEVPIACVVPRACDDREALQRELEAYARSQLGRLKAPEAIHLVEESELPRGPLGKVVKREIRERYLAAGGFGDA